MSRWPWRIESGRSCAEPFGQLRLVVEQVHLRGRAGLVQIDDALRFRREVGEAGEALGRERSPARRAKPAPPCRCRAPRGRTTAGASTSARASRAGSLPRDHLIQIQNHARRRSCRPRVPPVSSPGRAALRLRSAASPPRARSCGTASRRCVEPASSTAISAADGARAVARRKPRPAARPATRPPSFIMRSASLRAVSMYISSLSSASACSGVELIGRRTTQNSRVGASKMVSEGGGDGALPEAVDAAPPEVRALGTLEQLAALEGGELLPQAVGLIRLHRGPAHLVAEQAGDQRAPGRESSRPSGARAGRARAGGSPGRARAVRATPATPAGRRPRSRSAAAWPSRPSRVRTNSVASQSSSSGWLGASPCEPKSSDVLTRPVPKYDCQ